jgi:hypothetical protein
MDAVETRDEADENPQPNKAPGGGSQGSVRDYASGLSLGTNVRSVPFLVGKERPVRERLH